MALIIESIHSCNLPAFMVPSDECDAVREADFEAEEQHEGFEGVETPVDEVAHEEVVCVGDVAAGAEEFH